MATYISTIEGLNAMRNNLAEEYILTRDLDFNDDASYANPANKTTYTTGSGWTPVGADPWADFYGIFNGGGFTIKNLRCHRPTWSNIGFFGFADVAEIMNVTFENASMQGLRACVVCANTREETVLAFVHTVNCTVVATSTTYGNGGAALVGNMVTQSVLYKCSVNGGTITGGLLAGSLVAFTENAVEIYECTSNANVIQTSSDATNSRCGGLVGFLSNTSLYDSSFYGTINAQAVAVGGLVGQAAFANVFRNVAACVQNKGNGVVGIHNNNSTYANNIWDMDVSGVYFDNIGIGLNTPQVQDIDTYLSLGFSIAEYSNYIAETWKIDDGVSYPIPGFIEVEVVTDITGTVVLANSNQVFAASIGIPVVTGSVELENAPQSISVEVENIITIVASLINETQQIETNGDVLIVAIGALLNPSQAFSASTSPSVNGQGTLANQSQTIEGQGQVLIQAEGSLENHNQSFQASSGFEVFVTVSLQNGQQTIIGLINNIVSVINAQLVNQQQSLQGNGDTLVAAFVSLSNPQQTFAASSSPFTDGQVSLSNGQQTIDAELVSFVSAVANLTNPSQSFLALTADMVGVIVGLLNQAQVLEGTAEVCIPCGIASILNQPQTIQIEAAVFIQANGSLSNPSQTISGDGLSIAINAFVGVQRVHVIYYHNKAINQLL